MGSKRQLVGLWLDDLRHDPNEFLNDRESDSGSGNIVRQWYDENMNGVQIQWTAVSNFWQFKDYIETNGVPDFVSLDHDLGRDPATNARKKAGQYEPTGADCALFLVSYCLRNGEEIPKNYIHSANKKRRIYISRAFKLGRMGKDPMAGVDLNNEGEFVAAADRFRAGLMNPKAEGGIKKFLKKNDQSELGAADRLARMKGLDKATAMFDDTSFRENNNTNNNLIMRKQLIRLTESDLHKIVKESVERILREGDNWYDNYRWYPNERVSDEDEDFFDSDEERQEFEDCVRRHGYDKPY